MAKLTITAEELEQAYEDILTILGAWTIDVDIEKKEVMIVLRRAFDEFQKETSIWQLKNQFGNIYGMPAGQVISNQIAVFNMNLVSQITDWFSSMARVGGKIPWHKDYIVLEPGRQIYDLSKESSKPYKPGSRRVHRVMWQGTPEIFSSTKMRGTSDTISGDDVLYSNAWNFTSNGLNYGNSRLMFLGHAFDTMLMLQSMEIRKKLLFSEYFYNISGDMLELFPMPGSKSLAVIPGTKLFYYYFDEKEVTAGRELTSTTNAPGDEDQSTMFKKLQVTGELNGSNKVFSLSPAPIQGSELVVLNGQTLTIGIDYNLQENILTFTDDYPPILSTYTLVVYSESPITDNSADSLNSGVDTLIVNPSQMSIKTIPWDMLSPWAKTWIWEWALARCKYIQGSKWRKIKKTFNSAENGYEIEFDYSSLLTEANEEMRQLKEDLRKDLEELNLLKLMQDKKEMVDAAKTINRGPRMPFIGATVICILSQYLMT